MALSIGFGNSVSLLPAIQATRLLTFASMGLSPIEHTCFSWSRFRTVSFPQYGFKVGISDGAFPNDTQRVARFASVLRARRFHRRTPRTEPRDVARLSTSVRAAFTALPQESSLRSGFCSPAHRRLSDPIRPTRPLVALSLYDRLYATSLLFRFLPS